MRTPSLRHRPLRAAVRIIAPTVVVTLGVVAVAWAAVSGAGIVDSSITGRDIRSNSVPGLDITNGTVARADLAPAERSEIIERILGNAVNVTAATTTVVLGQRIPAGSWKLQSTVALTRSDPGSAMVTCTLRKEGSPELASRTVVLGGALEPASSQVIDMTTTITLPAPTTVQVACHALAPVSATTAQIIAERFGKATQIGFWPLAT